MSLTILSIAYPFAPVGADAVGGAEQILSALDFAIVNSGHRSLVAAREGSQTAGTLIATKAPSGVLTPAARARATADHQRSIDFAIRNYDCDLLHLHGIDFHSYRISREIPALVTLHLPPEWYPREIWTDSAFQLQCVSESQMRRSPLASQPLRVIENGVPPNPYARIKRVQSAHDFALVLGRICPEKNIHSALDAGTIASTPVLIGGQVFPYPEHQRYFEQEIEPRLRNGHRLLGVLNADRKQRLLAAAKCLLVPSLSPETSSLVAMEALAAGTPVIAYRSGALPEIVGDGVTGFLVTSPEEMAHAIPLCERIDPDACREAAASRFSQQRMVREYLDLYQELVGCREYRAAA